MLAGLIAAVPAPQSPSVRTEIERRYEENRRAFMARDSGAVLRLRHPAFHTVDAAGQANTRAQFETRTGVLLGAIVQFDTLTFAIDSLTVKGDTAIVVMRQRTARRQRLMDGSVHFVQTGAVQRELWVRAPEGWLMWQVDQVHPDPVFVDGQQRAP